METTNNTINNTINYNDYFAIKLTDSHKLMTIVFNCVLFGDVHIIGVLVIYKTAFKTSKYSKMEYNNSTICKYGNTLYLHKNCFIDFVKEYTVGNNYIDILVIN